MRSPLLLALLLALALPAAAQDAPRQEATPVPVEPGERVRVTFRAEAPGGDGTRYRWTGRAEALSADTLYFYHAVTGYVVPLPFSTLDRLDTYVRTERPVWRSVKVGAGVGAVAFGGVALATCSSGNCLEGAAPPIALGGAVVGAGVGALVGLGIGLIPRTRWEAVPLPERVRVGAAGAGVGLVWRLPTAQR